jgi:hypothetical protein
MVSLSIFLPYPTTGALSFSDLQSDKSARWPSCLQYQTTFQIAISVHQQQRFLWCASDLRGHTVSRTVFAGSAVERGGLAQFSTTPVFILLANSLQCYGGTTTILLPINCLGTVPKPRNEESHRDLCGVLSMEHTNRLADLDPKAQIRRSSIPATSIYTRCNFCP